MLVVCANGEVRWAQKATAKVFYPGGRGAPCRLGRPNSADELQSGAIADRLVKVACLDNADHALNYKEIDESLRKKFGDKISSYAVTLKPEAGSIDTIKILRTSGSADIDNKAIDFIKSVAPV